MCFANIVHTTMAISPTDHTTTSSLSPRRIGQPLIIYFPSPKGYINHIEVLPHLVNTEDPTPTTLTIFKYRRHESGIVTIIHKIYPFVIITLSYLNPHLSRERRCIIRPSPNPPPTTASTPPAPRGNPTPSPHPPPRPPMPPP